MTAPLHGIHIVEFEGIGPGPLAGRILAGMGAEITQVVRPTKSALHAHLGSDASKEWNRGKKRVSLDLKDNADRDQAFDLVCRADALIEGNRPGVMERLRLGPAEFAEKNPRLVYGRMTGWGQTGPLAKAAGHDLNYAALTGMLALSARRGELPIVPPTMVGDAPGALGLAFGMVCALFDAKRSGKGCVVDAAIVDIVAMLGGIAQWIFASGQLGGDQPSAFHDSPFYDVYRCADGQFITIGPLEPQFYALLLEKLGLNDVDPALQYDTAMWPALKDRFRALFAGRTRDHWCTLLEGTDACFAPVLSLAEAAVHPHNRARENFVSPAPGIVFGNPAPRFSPLKPR
ncbi:MAG: CoA transferase [Gammaproteobacteria bacterium]|nr:CoA transferase [Gammaproteobacteria bacterium]MBU1414826.1 CoA transferase [Gammaproteobacteria bacterium]